MLRLSALYRYPLKSGKAEALQQVGLDQLGLDGDRRWMLVDAASGRFLTQRAVAKMSQLSALWNSAGGLTLSTPGMAPLEMALPGSDAELRGVTIWRDTLRVPDAGDAAAAWVSDFIGKATRLVQMPLARARSTEAGFGKDNDQVAKGSRSALRSPVAGSIVVRMQRAQGLTTRNSTSPIRRRFQPSSAYA